MRRMIAPLAALLLSSAALGQSTVMPVPLVGTGVGLQTSVAASKSGAVAAAGPTSFYGVTVTLTAGQGPGFVMLFDSATVPADGAVSPMRCFYSDGGPRTTTFGSSNMPLSTMYGLSWAFSSAGNCQTKTSATANFVAVSYKQQMRR